MLAVAPWTGARGREEVREEPPARVSPLVLTADIQACYAFRLPWGDLTALHDAAEGATVRCQMGPESRRMQVLMVAHRDIRAGEPLLVDALAP